MGGFDRQHIPADCSYVSKSTEIFNDIGANTVQMLQNLVDYCPLGMAEQRPSRYGAERGCTDDVMMGENNTMSISLACI